MIKMYSAVLGAGDQPSWSPSHPLRKVHPVFRKTRRGRDTGYLDFSPISARW